MEDDIGKAEVLERGHLETSRVFVGDHETFAVATKTLKPWESKKSRPDASDRSFTVGDKTREKLLQGRKYLGTRKHELFALIIHSCIELFLSIEKHPQGAIFKAEIKPSGQRHPHVWAREALPASNGSWITVGFSRYLHKGSRGNMVLFDVKSAQRCLQGQFIRSPDRGGRRRRDHYKAKAV